MVTRVRPAKTPKGRHGVVRMAGKEESHSIAKRLCLGGSAWVGQKAAAVRTAGAKEGLDNCFA